MQDQILEEIKQLKQILAELIGTSKLAPEEQFSKSALDKASVEFKQLKQEKDDWIKEYDLYKYFKTARHSIGKFIRIEFKFNSCIKEGYYYLYSKKDILALSRALKERNVDLGLYIDLKASKDQFKKKIRSLPKAPNLESKRKTKAFKLPGNLKNVNTTPVPPPRVELVRQDIANLKKEFLSEKLGDYIDILKGTYAALKHMYYFERYLEPGVRKRCKRWCDKFNYANHALELITNKKEKFLPINETDMIEL